MRWSWRGVAAKSWSTSEPPPHPPITPSPCCRPCRCSPVGTRAMPVPVGCSRCRCRCRCPTFHSPGARARSYGGVSAGMGAGSTGTIDKAEAVVEEIVAAGGTALADGGSVADFSAVGAMVAKAEEAWGRLDIAIVNAGIYRDRRIGETSPHPQPQLPSLQRLAVHRASDGRGLRPDDGRAHQRSLQRGQAGVAADERAGVRTDRAHLVRRLLRRQELLVRSPCLSRSLPPSPPLSSPVWGAGCTARRSRR